jgi:hypothetical protein
MLIVFISHQTGRMLFKNRIFALYINVKVAIFSFPSQKEMMTFRILSLKSLRTQ